MGQTASNPTANGFPGKYTPPRSYDLPPVKFHRKHGDNIMLSNDGFVATRHESFCKGIVFSNRPVMIAERVCIKVANMSGRWNGVLRVGFSAHDPSNMAGLPNYACPDLTSKPGYWAKAVSEAYISKGTLIHYYVAGNGDVHFGANGHDLGMFFSGIDTRQPLWAMIDLYGNCTSLEMVDSRSSLNNFSLNSSSGSTRAPSRNCDGIIDPLPPSHSNQALHSPVHVILPNPQPVARLPSPPAPLTLPDGPGIPRPMRTSVSNASVNSVSFPPLKYNNGISFRTMSFHRKVGRNIRLEASNTVGKRLDEEFAQGYVFSSTTIKPGDRILVQILATEDAYIGSIAFGLTNCDPASIDTEDLPEDSDLLLDRPEYWVVSKDVANCPGVGDELSFQINLDGSVEFSKNGNIPSVFMHVDTSLPLWAFWDIYGHTLKIRLIGSTVESVARPANQTLNPASPYSSAQPSALASAQDYSMNQSQPLSECTICFEKAVDCVLYTCGHMCMCYECALQQWRGRGAGSCPICRTEIRDVIKTFRS